MKKKIISILLSLSMAFTMMISSATMSFADTLLPTIPTATLLEFLTQQKTDSNDILSGLDLGIDMTDLQSLLKLFDIKDLSSLLTKMDMKELSELLTKMDMKDLSTLVSKLDVQALSDIINKIDFNELKTLLSKFDLTELGDLFNKSNLNDVKTLTKATVEKAAEGSTNSIIVGLVEKANTAIDAAKNKNDVIAAGDKYVELITAALDAIKEEEAKRAAEQREAELREAAEKLAAEKKLAEETKPVQNKLKVTSKGSFKVSYEEPELDGIVNYEIQRATDKAFTKSLKTYTTKNLTLTNSKNLKKGTKYYFRVRANVQLSDSTMVTTAWSNVRYTKATKTR